MKYHHLLSGKNKKTLNNLLSAAFTFIGVKDKFERPL